MGLQHSGSCNMRLTADHFQGVHDKQLCCILYPLLNTNSCMLWPALFAAVAAICCSSLMGKIQRIGSLLSAALSEVISMQSLF